ncbi:uncharacterized protein EV420DRAFT_1595046 [Desarmillaria tabescens]|uniref:Uncharacterized protein n=1 Tax=Armillaria tabescens TaxID=1929756 RepID=A0AA39J2L5_ARMTA|nr:uncharacterized protein EV420DRAFT_1595046 [Desarmillaria tabescens]KAK0434977.1 hypothetical protein EV420DRAFT_1595046 [Desarmillaria tabescens]
MPMRTLMALVEIAIVLVLIHICEYTSTILNRLTVQHQSDGIHRDGFQSCPSQHSHQKYIPSSSLCRGRAIPLLHKTPLGPSSISLLSTASATDRSTVTLSHLNLHERLTHGRSHH